MTEALTVLDAADGELCAIGAGGLARVRRFAGREAAEAWLVATIARTLSEAVEARGRALWLGCGGTTPKPIYERLTAEDLDWAATTLVQVDERFVPTDSAQSNTRMMREALAQRLGDGGMNFVSLIQDIADVDSCAARAEALLFELGGGALPVFDLALMGMGADAHYASIFPGHPVNAYAYSTRALVLPVTATNDGSEPVLTRLSLSVPVISATRRILFYITGAAKLEVLERASGDADPFTSPIGAFLRQTSTPVEFIWAP